MASSTLLLLLMGMYCGYVCTAIQIYYMDETCGSQVDMSDVHSASVESSKALTYPNSLRCTVTYTAPAGKRFYLQVNRFITEESGSRCYDYLSIYDGADTSTTPLAEKLCGELTGKPVYNSTGEHVTFKFITDSTAKERGFAVFIMAFTTGTCGSDEHSCESLGLCIDKDSSVCDDYNHCGDNSDEEVCAGAADEQSSSLLSSIGLIVGVCLVAVAVIIIVILIAYFAYKRYKWNQYLKHLYGNKNMLSTKLEASYPLTHTYQSNDLINITRAQRDAALVKMENDENENNMPLGSSTSLASSTLSELSKKSKDTEPLPGDSSEVSTSSQAIKPSPRPSTEPVEKQPEPTDQQQAVEGSDRGSEVGYDNEGLDMRNEKVTEL